MDFIGGLTALNGCLSHEVFPLREYPLSLELDVFSSRRAVNAIFTFAELVSLAVSSVSSSKLSMCFREAKIIHK